MLLHFLNIKIWQKQCHDLISTVTRKTRFWLQTIHPRSAEVAWFSPAEMKTHWSCVSAWYQGDLIPRSSYMDILSYSSFKLTHGHTAFRTCTVWTLFSTTVKQLLLMAWKGMNIKSKETQLLLKTMLYQCRWQEDLLTKEKNKQTNKLTLTIWQINVKSVSGMVIRNWLFMSRTPLKKLRNTKSLERKFRITM